MGLDLVFLIVLVWYGFKGYKKGLVKVIFSAIAIVVATLGALKLSGKIANYFFEKNSDLSPWVPMISFVLVFTGIMMFTFLISKTIDAGLKKVMLGGVNRLSGLILYGLIVTFVFSTLLWLADKVHLINPETKASSLTYNYIAPVAPKGFEVIGMVLPFVKSSYMEMNALLDKANETLP